MQTILSSFLAAGLLPIGADDEKLELLEGAAGVLADQIAAARPLAYRFALVGLDDRIAITDPVLKMAEEAVVSKWQTITNKIGPNPVQVYRAVILRALELVGGKNPAMNQAVGLIAQNEPALHSTGKERAAITAMLERLVIKAADEMMAAWVNPVAITLPKLSTKVKKTLTGKDELTSALARASGPSDKDGKAIPGANPHWPNAGQPWSQEFIGRASEAIHAAIQSASKGFAEDIQEALTQSVQGLVTAVERLAIRDAKAELLWIRTSMYSPSAQQSYRDLKPTELILHSAIDTSRAVASNAPPSVEFFLRDLVASISKKKLRVGEVLTEIATKLTTLTESTLMHDDPLPADGRRTWLDVSVRPGAAGNFEQQTGVPSTWEENAAELAVRFYRELQIRKLLSPAK